MCLSSMTGFARANAIHAGLRCDWEVRSFNGRGLDIRMRLPSGFESLELQARNAIAGMFSRGSISATLTLTQQSATPSLCLNEANLQIAIAAFRRIEELTGASAIDGVGLLNVRGVLEASGISDNAETLSAAQTTALETLSRALEELRDARRSEGARLDEYLRSHIDEIERLTEAARTSKARTPEAIREHLRGQLLRLLEADTTQSKLDSDRLYQEAILLAAKADITEELDRLKAHVDSARELLVSERPVGRKLDFLVQEFNREANTLCSKSNHIEITRIGLAMKVAIDQFREQIQNVE